MMDVSTGSEVSGIRLHKVIILGWQPQATSFCRCRKRILMWKQVEASTRSVFDFLCLSVLGNNISVIDKCVFEVQW